MSNSRINKIISDIQELDPKEISLEDIDNIIYSAYAKKEILRGLEDIKQGKTISHEEVKKRLTEKWLK